MIKMEARDLLQLLESKPLEADYVQARSVADTIAKNVELKEQVVRMQGLLQNAEMQVKAAEQRASFPAKYAEQKRIVQGIRKLLPKKRANDLLFKLALGDIT